MEQQITANVILEMLGAPKEYIEHLMKEYVEKLKKNGLTVQTEVFAEAKEQGKLFTTFAELSIEFKNLKQLLDFCFDSMPSSIEIIKPEKIELDSALFTDYLNDLQAKLHEVDMLVKGVRAQKKLLDQNALNIFKNFIKYALEEPKEINELAKVTGIGLKELKPFLENLVKNNFIKFDGEKYSQK